MKLLMSVKPSRKVILATDRLRCASQGMSTTDAELIAHVRSKLGGFKAPKSIAFVETLPPTVVGKVLRRHVRDKYWQGRQRQVG